MPTIEERIALLETTSRTHDVMLNLLISIGERQLTMLEGQRETLDEVRRDAKQTQRLWVRLAKRHGWLEDSDLEEE